MQRYYNKGHIGIPRLRRDDQNRNRKEGDWVITHDQQRWKPAHVIEVADEVCGGGWRSGT